MPLRPAITARLVGACALTAMLLATFALGARAAVRDLPDFERLVDANSSAVVSIRTHRAPAGPDHPPVPEFLQRHFRFPAPSPDRAPQAQGIGSGVIASADGYVLTNAHVVDGARDIVVQLHDRREFPARLVGADGHTDIAVLKIDGDNLPAATFGDSDDLRVGQWVLAIGAPFGLSQTATQGIVSAVSRSLPNDTYVPFIQTDVAVNPGNSGGPLFNLDGDVVGINSQIFSRTGGYMGLSFAIPINLAVAIADQLKTNGRIARGWLGISIQDLDHGLAQSFGLTTPHGALVSAVTPNSPAARAQLQAGDVILEFNGTRIESSANLPPLVASAGGDATVTMAIWRDGRARDIELVTGLLPDDDAVAATEVPESGRLGLVVSDLTAAERSARGLANGVRIDRVDPDKAGADAGLRADDVIVSFNHESIDNVAELAALSRGAEPGTTVPLLVQRDDLVRFLALTLPGTG